jgi:ElaB/YqjD/DUF883 family membrane-anchored ribosome-binding protein
MEQINKREDLTFGREGSDYEPTRGRSGSTFDNIKTTVADKLKTAAGAIRQKAVQPDAQQGALGDYGARASNWLDASADYIREANPDQIKKDVQDQVRRNPGRSLQIAGGAGLILGALFRRR